MDLKIIAVGMATQPPILFLITRLVHFKAPGALDAMIGQVLLAVGLAAAAGGYFLLEKGLARVQAESETIDTTAPPATGRQQPRTLVIVALALLENPAVLGLGMALMGGESVPVLALFGAGGLGTLWAVMRVLALK